MISSSSSHRAQCEIRLPIGIEGVYHGGYGREYPELRLWASGESTAEAEALIREALRAIAAEIEKA